LSLKEGRWALAAGVVVHLLMLLSLRGQFLNPLFVEARDSHGQAADYFGIYAAGDHLVHGRSIYQTNAGGNGATEDVPYSYFYRYLPPTAYVAALSSLFLSPWTGYLVWVIATELLLLLAVRGILRFPGARGADRRLQAGIWLGFLPFYLEQWMGQFSLLMAFFLWTILRGAETGRSAGMREAPPGKGGLIAWAASIALKSYTALFALSYLRRGWIRPVLYAAGLVILSCAPYYLARPEDLGTFLELNLGLFPGEIYPGTLGLSAFVRQAGWCLPDELASRRLALAGLDVSVGNLPVVAANLLILGLSVWIVLRHGRRCSMTLQISLWVLAFFLIFKDVWEYHYVMLLPVLSVLALRYRSPLIPWLALALALPTPYLLVADRQGGLTQIGSLIQHASKALPTLALFIWVVATARREANRGTGARGPIGSRAATLP